MFQFKLAQHDWGRTCTRRESDFAINSFASSHPCAPAGSETGTRQSLQATCCLAHQQAPAVPGDQLASVFSGSTMGLSGSRFCSCCLKACTDHGLATYTRSNLRSGRWRQIAAACCCKQKLRCASPDQGPAPRQPQACLSVQPALATRSCLTRDPPE